MSPVNYSKWDKIEVSDDEDDTHPNIETESLFRMRHRTRIEKMAERKRERESLQKQLSEAQKILAMLEKSNQSSNVEEEVRETKCVIDELERKLKSLDEEERKQPWNIDTICKAGFDKSRINKAPPKTPEPIKPRTEEEKTREYETFCDNNDRLLRDFGMLKKFEDSKQFLLQNPDLCSEYSADFLLELSLEHGLDERRSLMDHILHQMMVIQYMLQLSKELGSSPKAFDFIRMFFDKLKKKEAYREMFEEELQGMRKRVADRLDVKLKKIRESENHKTLGPGGLDPKEVFESLPPEMQKCFKERDLKALETVGLTMEENEFEFHMKRCVEAGLWEEKKQEDSQQQKQTKKDAKK